MVHCLKRIATQSPRQTTSSTTLPVLPARNYCETFLVVPSAGQSRKIEPSSFSLTKVFVKQQQPQSFAKCHYRRWARVWCAIELRVGSVIRVVRRDRLLELIALYLTRLSTRT